jgi:DnaJ-class molecular chaperone
MPRRDRYDITDEMRACPECGGAGVVPDPRAEERRVPCPLCGGLGRVSSATANRGELSAYRKRQARARRAQVQGDLRDAENADERRTPKTLHPSRALREARERNRDDDRS